MTNISFLEESAGYTLSLAALGPYPILHCQNVSWPSLLGTTLPPLLRSVETVTSNRSALLQFAPWGKSFSGLHRLSVICDDSPLFRVIARMPFRRVDPGFTGGRLISLTSIIIGGKSNSRRSSEEANTGKP